MGKITGLSLVLVLVLVVAGIAFLDGPAGACRASTDCSGLPDGSACDDGAGCTVGEACLSGSCLAPLSLVPAPDSVITPGSYLAIVSGDWNEDGELDLAAIDSGYPAGNLTSLLGNGLGGFEAAGSPVPVGSAVQLVAADWNGDGHLDLAAPMRDDVGVELLAGDGLGHFVPTGAPLVVTTSPSYPALVLPGDFNRDGNLDFVVQIHRTNSYVNSLKIFLGGGSGTFTEGPPVWPPESMNLEDVVAGDWNGDGNLDLALARYSPGGAPPDGTLTILLGDGHGGFSQAAGSAIYYPFQIAVGDWNGDGAQDLAVSTADQGITSFLGNGSGGFSQAGPPISYSTYGTRMIVGEFNGDGKLDLFVCRALLGDGSGAFHAIPGAASSCGYSVTAGDWNDDGKLDVAFTADAGRITVQMGTGSGTFAQLGAQVAAGANPGSLALGDFDEDGVLDLVSANFGSNDVSVLRGNGVGGAFAQVRKSVGTSPSCVVSGDWNLDGKLDLATANFGSNDVTILSGDGTGAFPTSSAVPAGHSPYALQAADLNRDGKLDLAVANYGTNDLTILLGGAGGTFSEAAGSPVAVGSRPHSIAAGDWNGDGKPDLAAANYGSGSVTILVGDGSGGFAPAPGSPVPLGSGLTALAVGDWNRDGRADLVVARDVSSSIVLLIGNGAGGFSQAGSPVPVGSNPFFVQAGDWNGDGLLDVATANNGSNDVSVLLGDGAGGFRQPPTSPIAAGTNPSALAALDLNRDGRLDLAVANNGSANVSILLNATRSAPHGAPCSDVVPCTMNDTCSGFACSGTPVPPSEVDAGVRLQRSGTSAVLTWNPASLATASDVLRGALSALPVGPGGNDEVCVADDLQATMAVDPSVPPPNTGYWYLIRGDGACGSGPYGTQGTQGAPGAPRVSTTCP